MAGPSHTSEATIARIDRSAGDLSTAATQRIEASHEWYRQLSAEERSYVAGVAHAGIATFIAWLREGRDPVSPADVFATAPRELTRSITLGHTLDLIRTVVDVVETDVTELAAPGEGQALREAVLRYSREVAFAAAQVYADAAEARGAWDARLEGLVVDAVLRGEADESMQSRAAALGWGSTSSVAVVVGGSPPGGASEVIDEFHRAARRVGIEALAAVQGRRFVAILGDTTDAMESARRLEPRFAPGPIVVGPTVPHLFAAGRSARAAISGYAAAPAWPSAPRPVHADDLLAERVLTGDLPARAALVDRIWRPLADDVGGLLDTASAYLEAGGSLEATARALFVHTNTVRYRLAGIEKRTGYALTDAHDAFTVGVALAAGRLLRSGRRVTP